MVGKLYVIYIPFLESQFSGAFAVSFREAERPKHLAMMEQKILPHLSCPRHSKDLTLGTI